MARNTYYQSSHWKALKKACHERDGWKCVVPGCTSPRGKGLTCDHIETRPNVSYPTPADVLPNTRTLCDFHDRQIKEKADGERRKGGVATVKGCDADGWPLDPNHSWRG